MRQEFNRRTEYLYMPEAQLYPDAPFWSSVGGRDVYASKDGHLIAFFSRRPGPPNDIILYDRDTGEKTTIATGLEIKNGKGNMSWNPQVNRVIVYTEQPAIREFDLEGNETNSLTSTGLGAIGDPIPNGSQVIYDPTDPANKIFICDPSNHVVVHCKWDGEVLDSWGTYGTAGSGDGYLDTPQTVATSQSLFYRTPDKGVTRVVIGDTNNHRVLWWHLPTDSIIGQLPFPQPKARTVMGNSIISVKEKGDFHLGNYIFFDNCIPSPAWFEPRTESLISHPSKPNIFLAAMHANALDREVFVAEPKNVPPVTMRLWEGESVSAGTALDSMPIPDWYRPHKTINIKPTQDGSMDIETARWVGTGTWWIENTASWDGSWDVIDKDITLTAGECYTLHLKRPLGILRVSVTLNADGEVDGWVNLR